MMAERKYDLLLTNTTNKNNRIQHQPWYRERLRTKYLKSLKSKELSKSLIARNWFLLKNGLDDFRDGLPRITNGSFLIQPRNLVKPKERAPKYRCFTKEQICYSKKFPLAEERWNKLQLLEYTLLQHPLALFPHLELCVDSKVFLDIVKLLDPEMYNPQSSDEMDISTKENTTMKNNNQSGANDIDRNWIQDPHHQTEEQRKMSETKSYLPSSGPAGIPNIDGETMRNPYRWLTKKEDKKEQNKGDRISDMHNDHVKNVIQEFCEWVSSLGGENSIDESMINAIFCNDYENKPTVSVPIEIVDISSGTHHNLDMSDKVYQDYKSVPSTKLKQRSAGNSKLSLLYCSQAFLEWINDRGYRKPEFLKEITLLQQQTKLKDVEECNQREKLLNPEHFKPKQL